MARASLGSAVWTLEADATPLQRALTTAEGLVERSSARIDNAFRKVRTATINTDHSFGALKLTAGQTALAFRSLGEVMALTNSVWLNSIRNAGELVVALARMASQAKAAKVATEAVAAINTEQFVTPAFQSLLYAPFDPTTLKHGAGGRFVKGTGAGPGANFEYRQKMKVLEALAEMERTAPRVVMQTSRLNSAFGFLAAGARRLAEALGIVNLTLGTLVTVGALLVAAFAAGYYAADYYINKLGGVAESTKNAKERTDQLTESLKKRDAAMRKLSRDQLRDSQNRIKSNEQKAFEEELDIRRSRSERTSDPRRYYFASKIPTLERERQQTKERMHELDAQIELVKSRLNRTWSQKTQDSINAEIASLRTEYGQEVDKLSRLNDMIREDSIKTFKEIEDDKEKRLADRIERAREAAKAELEIENEAQKQREAIMASYRTGAPGDEYTVRQMRLMSGLVAATSYAGIRGAIGAGASEDKQLTEQKRTNSLLMQLIRQRGGLRN